MTNKSKKPVPNTFFTVLSEIGWLSRWYIYLVGTPSVLALLKESVKDLKYTIALQWVVDGYNDVVAVLAGIVEPLFLPWIGMLGTYLGVDLELHPHWQPIFLLLSCLLMCELRQDRDSARARGFTKLLLFLPALLIGSLAAGVIPNIDTGFHQLGIVIVATASYVVAKSFDSFFWAIGWNLKYGWRVRQLQPQPLFIYLFTSVGMLILLLAVSSLVTWSVYWTLSRSGSFTALISILLLNLIIGSFNIRHGLRNARPHDVNFGLHLIGAPVLAGLVVGADLLIQHLPKW